MFIRIQEYFSVCELAQKNRAKSRGDIFQPIPLSLKSANLKLDVLIAWPKTEYMNMIASYFA